MNLDDDLRVKVQTNMAGHLNNSVKMMKALEEWRNIQNFDPMEFIIALSTYAEFNKQEFCKNISETNVILDKNPETKRYIDAVTKKEFGPEAVAQAEQIRDPKQVRESIDRITDESVKLILKHLDNKNIYDKIQSVLKGFNK